MKIGDSVWFVRFGKIMHGKITGFFIDTWEAPLTQATEFGPDVTTVSIECPGDDTLYTSDIDVVATTEAVAREICISRLQFYIADNRLKIEYAQKRIADSTRTIDSAMRKIAELTEDLARLTQE